MSPKILLLLLSLVAFAHGLGGIVGRGQKVTVVGKLVCNGAPAKDVKVKMYEDGTVYDTKLDTTNTLPDGTFNVMGSQKKIRKIDPKINIYHRCNHVGLCTKKVIIHVPKNAVAKGTEEAQLYDIGTLNLANKFPGETTDCIH